MRYEVIGNTKEIALGIYELITRLKKESTNNYFKSIGNPAGSQEFDVFWNNRVKLWYAYNFEPDKHWLSYGLNNPEKSNYLSAMVQTCIPIQGMNKSYGGVLLKNADGKVYLAHTGNIGGGKDGVCKSEFVSYYQKIYNQKGMAITTWTDGSTSDVFIISRIDDEYLAENIAKFVNIIADFKEYADSKNRFS
jgi:hypothetical protein